jgi:hypothetical protein
MKKLIEVIKVEEVGRVLKVGRFMKFILIIGIVMLSAMQQVFAQAESPKEDDFFKIMKVPAPEGTILEVGGLCTLPNGSLAVTTRRGDIFIVENPTSQHPFFRKFASGLHEVLGRLIRMAPCTWCSAAS